MSEFPEKTLPDYYESIRRAIQVESSAELSRLISIDLVHRPTFIRFAQNANQREYILDESWSTIVECHIKAVRHLILSNIQEAFNEKTIASNELCKIISAHNGSNWCMGFMNKHSVDLRRLAIRADAETNIRALQSLGDDGNAKSPIKKEENVEKACDSLMQLFRVCATDTRTALTSSKRMGMICIINQLFKIYFRINKLNLCKPLIRALENSQVLERCSMAQKVTYKYYLGVKNLFDVKIAEAEELLDYVFRNCHPSSRKNKRLTLIFLIPIKMLLGQMPSQQLLKEYDLRQFDEIKGAVISGNVGRFDTAMETQSAFLWRYGIYLTVERLRPIALRNLFKKVAKIADSHLVDMDMLLNAVKLVSADDDIDMGEVTCLLSNLIYQGKIKGYLSVPHRKLVLSKADPFPSIAEVAKKK